MRKPGLGGSGMGTSSVNTRPLISGSWRMNSELMLNFCTSVGFAMYIPCPKLENVIVAPRERIKNIVEAIETKEVCNGGVACSLLKLGSLEKTVIASLFHSGLHSSSPFFVKKTTLHDLLPS